MSAEQDTRLDRIEKKIDDLSTAMISLARAEEKLIAIEKQAYATYERMNKHSNKLDELDEQVHDNTRVIGLIGKVFWLVVTLATGATVAMLTGVSG
jgi:phage shock protein A